MDVSIMFCATKGSEGSSLPPLLPEAADDAVLAAPLADVFLVIAFSLLHVTITLYDLKIIL